jgi:hypothetical protein
MLFVAVHESGCGTTRIQSNVRFRKDRALGLPFTVIVSHNLVSPLLPDSDRIIVRGVAIMIMRTRA